MANKRITDLTNTTTYEENDVMMIDGTNGTRKISFKALFEKIKFSELATTAKNIIGAINELNTKIEIENKTVTINTGTDYSYISYKTGYVLSAVHGTTFNGVYTTGIADTGSNYAVFFNTEPVSTADITLRLTWVKI